jgi:cellulose synthase (UDP-forming)
MGVTLVAGTYTAVLELIAAMSVDSEGDPSADLVLADEVLATLADREWSPLGAIESIRAMIRAVDVDRDDEAQPVLPMATISLTEDMATCMRLHSMGWRSAYHHEKLCEGLAPEDAGTTLTQRLRWAQGTIQVMLRENPPSCRRVSAGARSSCTGRRCTAISPGSPPWHTLPHRRST